MALRIVSGIAILIATLLVIITVNTLRIGPPRLPEIMPGKDIAIDWSAAAQRLAEAIRFRTISRAPDAPVADEAMRGLHQLLERSYPAVHRTLMREVVNDYSLLYTWQGAEPDLKPIVLAAHMDVVPVESGTEVDWTHPPFAGTIDDGFIWGRGTLDMKPSLMGLLEAVEFLLDQGFKPKRTVYLAFGHDEEIGGSNGAARIAELLGSRGVRLDFTLDEGLVITHGIVPGVAPPAALIGIAEKGKVTLELTAHGEGGPSFRPPSSTATAKLGRALDRLETHQMAAALKSPVVEMFEYIAPEMPFALRAVIANQWLVGPLLISRLEQAPATNASVRTTTVATIIRGGTKANLVPTEATAVIDIRILPGDSIASVIEHVRRTIDDPEITIRQFGSEPSEPTPISNMGSDSFAALRKSIRSVFPDTVVAPGMVIGRTDSRHYVDIADNSYRFLPIRLTRADLARIHGTNERLAVRNYIEIIQFYVQLILNSAQSTRVDALGPL